MIEKIYQKRQHTETTNGDCWRACLASILCVDIETFSDPNDFDNWSDYVIKVLEQLYSLGYDLITYEIKDYPGYDRPVIAIGKSPRGDWYHAVVWKDGHGIIHDPHESNKGVENIKFFEVLDKI
jgi:hypothetical protein